MTRRLSEVQQGHASLSESSPPSLSLPRNPFFQIHAANERTMHPSVIEHIDILEARKGQPDRSSARVVALTRCLMFHVWASTFGPLDEGFYTLPRNPFFRVPTRPASSFRLAFCCSRINDNSVHPCRYYVFCGLSSSPALYGPLVPVGRGQSAVRECSDSHAYWSYKRAPLTAPSPHSQSTCG